MEHDVIEQLIGVVLIIVAGVIVYVAGYLFGRADERHSMKGVRDGEQ